MSLMRCKPPRRRDILALTLLGCSGPGRAGGDSEEDVGTSSAALSLAPGPQNALPRGLRMQGEFVIHNPTNFKVGYSVRWGDGPWNPHTIEPRYLRRHWHVLDANGRAPRPQLQFDRVANDQRVTNKTYDMKFGRVGHSPATGPVNQAVNYEFVANGNLIDVVRR